MMPFVAEAADDVKTCPACGQRVHMRHTFGGLVCPLCGHKSSGGHESKEGRRMAPQSSDVARLLAEASRADTHTERQRLMGEAEEARTQIAAAHQATRDVDLASAVVADRLTPVRVHEHHTAATDWLGGIETTAAPDAEREMVAQGSVWYAKLADIVKQHPDELAQQAYGMGRRLAGRYGSGADAAERAFLDHVGMLHARDVHQGLITLVAASGVPQVGDAGNPEQGLGLEGEQVTMGLPAELTSSERAPAIQTLENNTTGGVGSDPGQLPQGNPDEGNGDEGDRQDDALRATSSRRTADSYWRDKNEQPLQVDPSNPSAAWNRWGNSPHWTDHQEGFEHGYMTEDRHREHDRTGGPNQAYHEGYDLGAHHYRQDLPRPHDLSAFSRDLGKTIFGSNHSERNTSMQTATCPACAGHGRVAVRTQAASGIDQIDQIVDAKDNPSATPYPTEVAFPWEMPGDSSQAIQETEQQLAEREQRKGASRKQAAERAAHEAAQRAYRTVMAGQDDSGWAGDNGAQGVGPGQQDGGNPGNTYPGNIADPDPVYGFGGDNGNQPLKPYGADEADDYTNNPGMNYQPGQPLQNDLGGRVNQVGASRRRSDDDPQIQQALAFARQRRALLDG
jgi:uncharacterized Zn finger protein (UPF0148 family)